MTRLMPVPNMLPGQTPYTEKEWEHLQQEISDIAKVLEEYGDDILKAQQKDLP